MSQDPLAYGHYYQQAGEEEGERGIVDDTFKKLRDTYKQYHSKQEAQGQPSQPQGYNPGGYGDHSYQSQGSSQQYLHGNQTQTSGPVGQDSYYQVHPGKPPKQDKLSGLFGKLQGAVTELGTDVAQRLGNALDPQAYAEYGHGKPQTENRFGSFAPPRQANDVKWYVDGCSYFYAVSKALEYARESIWILDWWLSPELYLRRPPAKNEQYRLDRMLQAAAQRGVRINIIVYKEVTQALTLSSSHTKHFLENLHPNIAVFRHPDHLLDGQELASEIASSLQNMILDTVSLAKMPGDTLKSMYGVHDDVILYWAHHEKLCLIDGRIAFMGGLDLCFGRWDTNQHAISDVHPTNLDAIVFPGQDYNNARVLDFQDVVHWENNQLDRKHASRMGWSDISVSLHGQVVEDLRRHFVERWNFLYDIKYRSRKDARYSKLALYGRPGSATTQYQNSQQPQSASNQQPPTSQQPGGISTFPPPPSIGSQGAPNYQQPGYTPSGHPPAQGATQQHTYTPESFPPPPSGGGQGASNYQQPGFSPSGHPPAQGATQHHTYTPDSFPPPPSVGGQGAPNYQQSGPSPSSHPPAQGTTQQYNYTPGSFPPPPSGGGQGAPNYQQSGPSPSGHPLAQGATQQYNYTADSFPPPPPGPPPSQSYVSTQAQAQDYSQAPHFAPPPNQETYHSPTRGIDDHYEGTRGHDDLERGFNPRRLRDELTGYGNVLRGQLAGQVHQYQDRLTSVGRPSSQLRGNMSCQIVRSCSKWSNGTPTEHSVADAYEAIIRNSEHFVYIENQFFITATGDSQKPVKNKIGAAIVERILRAARAGEKYKIIVVIPAVPAFAGDLHDESSLGTRAIMEFQYNSINRGGHSIMELIAKEGYNPMDYIRFYNLRNYDRINVNSQMADVEQRSGVNYEDARQQHDLRAVGQGNYGPGAPTSAFDTTASFQQYQQVARQEYGSKSASGRWDSVSECYMLNGEDIRNVPWEGPSEAEIDAFVTEELYVHTKVMIADDRVVICGSANLNDRSQLGDHDSEIAVIIEDHTPIQSNMNGKPWTASRFAASLRRQLFRKHLGLLPPQDYERPDANFEPLGVPNQFDFESPESQIVADPLADTFHSLWNTRARTNTEVFRQVFHVVPDDSIRNWATYKEFYGYYFHNADKQAHGDGQDSRPARYEYGHVVRDDFAPGPEGVKQVKELLSKVKGTLVEMPLMFLIEEDVAKEGLSLNDLTEPLYT